MAEPLSFDPRVASEIIRDELERAKQLIINHIRINGENASGRTIASLHVEMQNEDEGVLYGRSPFGTLETGRKAGKIPYSFRSIILQWMTDKGLHGTSIPYKTNRPHKYTPQERGDLSMAGAIAYTIAKKGSKLYRTGGRADVYSDVVPDTIKRLGDRLMFLVSQSVEHIKLNNETIGG